MAGAVMGNMQTGAAQGGQGAQGKGKAKGKGKGKKGKGAKGGAKGGAMGGAAAQGANGQAAAGAPPPANAAAAGAQNPAAMINPLMQMLMALAAQNQGQVQPAGAAPGAAPVAGAPAAAAPKAGLPGGLASVLPPAPAGATGLSAFLGTDVNALLARQAGVATQITGGAIR